MTAYELELEKILQNLNDNGMEDLAAVLKQCDSMKGMLASTQRAVCTFEDSA